MSDAKFVRTEISERSPLHRVLVSMVVDNPRISKFIEELERLPVSEQELVMKQALELFKKYHPECYDSGGK